MNECHTRKVRKSSISIETSRKLAAALTGKKRSPETIEKLRRAPLAKKFHPRCNKCNNREGEMCVRFNMKSSDTRDKVCFRSYMNRKEHPDYIRDMKLAGEVNGDNLQKGEVCA